MSTTLNRIKTKETFRIFLLTTCCWLQEMTKIQIKIEFFIFPRTGLNLFEKKIINFLQFSWNFSCKGDKNKRKEFIKWKIKMKNWNCEISMIVNSKHQKVFYETIHYFTYIFVISEFFKSLIYLEIAIAIREVHKSFI